ncbi:MAG: glycosyltransferase family 2 protein [candidate division WOR-3 bacterium]|nr:glycosyltransferase family 2 protein [candidate division WOR-3 bacterium]
MDLRDIGAVIPAFNAEKTISTVINDLVNYGFSRDNIIVVNDGSSDRTEELTKKQGVNLLKHEQNLGKGAALRNGFNLARKSHIKKIFVIDADAQHKVSEIDSFLEINGRYDITIGERENIFKHMPLDRLLTNRTVNLVVSLLSGVRTTDVQCGFRYIDLKIFDEIELRTNKYEIESEMVIEAARKKFRIGFVPVSTIYGSEKSHISPMVDTVRFITMAVRFLWR